ncbi:MAG TPA: hypothetical protein VHE55_01910 [Fimbriimonadaceae bacterium]|nr:hypothetical protein [Fimbriimonadaceae bacterium]
MTRRRERTGFAGNLLLVMLACCVAFFSVSPPPMTPDGKQCPTAPIQTISVPVKSCCGKVLCYEHRAPKPGEAGFVQCRCAEKRASQQRNAMAPKVPLYLPVEAEPLEVAGRLDFPETPVPLDEQIPKGLAKGLFRPPSIA